MESTEPKFTEKELLNFVAQSNARIELELEFHRSLILMALLKLGVSPDALADQLAEQERKRPRLGFADDPAAVPDGQP